VQGDVESSNRTGHPQECKRGGLSICQCFSWHVASGQFRYLSRTQIRWPAGSRVRVTWPMLPCISSNLPRSTPPTHRGSPVGLGHGSTSVDGFCFVRARSNENRAALLGFPQGQSVIFTGHLVQQQRILGLWILGPLHPANVQLIEFTFKQTWEILRVDLTLLAELRCRLNTDFGRQAHV
jgi:hypothetical protein